MKKTTILLGMLSLSFAYAQQQGDPTGKVGVNTNTPKETLDVKGTAKVQDLPTAGASKIYDGQSTKGATFTPTKTVVADANGVLGVVEHIVESGTTDKTALQWDNRAKKWVAVAPTATGAGTDTSIYNNDGAIPAGTNRMVTLTDPGTGGTTGATLNFTLPTGTNKAFNIIQGDGARGFSLSTKAGQTQNLINFFNDGATAQGYLGFTTDNDFRIKNENSGKIFLENEVKIGTLNDIGTNSNKLLVADNNGVVKYINASNGQYLGFENGKWTPKAIPADTNTTYAASESVLIKTSDNNKIVRAALTGDVTAVENSNSVTVTKLQGKAVATTAPTANQVLKWDTSNGGSWVPSVDENDQAWKKRSTSERITNADDSSAIYRNSSIGIGDFSTEGVASSLHIKKANTNDGYTFAKFQVSDKVYTDDNLASILEFTDSNKVRYGFLGDYSTGAKNFEVRGEKGYNVVLSSYADGNGRANDKAVIELSGEGLSTPTTPTNKIRIKFNSGRWNNNTTKNGITTVSKDGNWRFGADTDRENEPADQKVVIDGALRFNGNTHTGLSHNNNAASHVQEGTMFYNNGHFFGVIPEGGSKKWKQLDNVDYTGAKGITVSGSTISLPDGGNAATGTNKKALTWNGNTWEATEIPGTDNDTKSPWVVAGTVANTDAGSGGTSASIQHNAQKYANGAYNTPTAMMSYSGRLGINVGLKQAELSTHMPGTLNISGPGTANKEQLSIQSGSKSWALFTHSGEVFTLGNRNLEANSTISQKFGLSTNGNLVVGDVTTNSDGNGLGVGSIGLYYEYTNKKLTIKGTPANDVSLHTSARVRIDQIPDKNDATYVLVQGDQGVVSRRAISSLTTAAVATEPWFVTGGTTQATNANNTAGNKNIYFKGGVGIGDFSSGEAINSLGNGLDKQTVKLAVKGAVLAGSFKGAHGATIFPDYVFQKYYTGTSSIKADYTFQSLSQVEDFVKTNGHLPGYKSAADIKAQGYIDVMETQISNVEKIEELYLHTIEQEKALKEKDAKIKALEERLERLEKLIK